MHGRAPSQPLLYTHSSTCSTSHPTTAMIPLGLASLGGMGEGEAPSLHSRAEWALLSTGLTHRAMGPPQLCRLPGAQGMALCCRTRLGDVAAWALLISQQSAALLQVPVCKSRAEFPQKQRRTLYFKGPHRYEFHLQMSESLPGYRKFWGQHCRILKFFVDQLQNFYGFISYHINSNIKGKIPRCIMSFWYEDTSGGLLFTLPDKLCY